jgi:hypothetical protein
MNIPASPDNVIRDIGAKRTAALRAAVDGAREDYATYRQAHPSWAAADSTRMLHNFIHERIWQRVAPMTDSFPDVSAVESMPTRDLYLGTQYRIRFKKHTLAGAVRSYPTDTALAFFSDPVVTLPSLEQVNLTVGYEWDTELREMGRPVMSLHSSMEEALWMVELPGDGQAGTVGVLRGPIDGPVLPTIYVPSVREDKGER